MRNEIKKLGREANRAERKLLKRVMDLDKSMDECSCDDATKYSFVNTIGHYEVHVFCLNCGGYITQEK